ncbi:MAG: hypothetical protein J4432_01245 [DPANN group archaeon]|nr:hypothetical protein [DPANN group archaeon]
MPEFETIKAEEYKYGNNFIEVARKRVPASEVKEGDDVPEFISISKGFYNKADSKRYKGGLGFPAEDSELREFLAKWIKEI